MQALILSVKLQQRLAMANDGLSLQMKDVSDAHVLAPSPKLKRRTDENRRIELADAIDPLFQAINGPVALDLRISSLR